MRSYQSVSRQTLQINTFKLTHLPISSFADEAALIMFPIFSLALKTHGWAQCVKPCGRINGNAMFPRNRSRLNKDLDWGNIMSISKSGKRMKPEFTPRPAPRRAVISCA
jgi:hypothetical protein